MLRRLGYPNQFVLLYRGERSCESTELNCKHIRMFIIVARETRLEEPVGPRFTGFSSSYPNGDFHTRAGASACVLQVSTLEQITGQDLEVSFGMIALLLSHHNPYMRHEPSLQCQTNLSRQILRETSSVGQYAHWLSAHNRVTLGKNSHLRRAVSTPAMPSCDQV